MALWFLDFSFFLKAFLVWLTWTVFSKLHDHLKLMNRIRNSGVPGFRGNPVLGLLPVLFNYIMFGPKNVPTNAVLLPIPLGMGVVFKKEGIFRLDGGLIRQVVVVYTKEGAEAVLNDPKEQKKSGEYRFVRDFTGSGLLTASYGKWKTHRKVLSPAFNPRITDSFQPVIYDHAHILVQSMKSKLGREPIVIEDLLSKCSLDIVTETTMGIKFESRSEDTVAYVTAVREVLKIIGKRIVTPWLWPDVLFRISPSGLKLRKNMWTVRNFVREIIKKKKAEIREDSSENPTEIPGAKRRPFLELLLLHNQRCGEADKLADEDILDETLTFTLAGFDTVSVSMYWTMYYMGLHPEVMKKAWTEVNAALQGDKEQKIRLDDLKQMEYLEAVIKETQRVRPAIPALMRILRNDVTLGGITLPKGTTVGVCLHTLHKNPEVFPDGEIFDPERFKDAKLNSFQFAPFSAGPKNCMGKGLAILEMKTILSNLIRHFDWKSLDEADDVLNNPDIVNRCHKPLKIIFWERP